MSRYRFRPSWRLWNGLALVVLVAMIWISVRPERRIRTVEEPFDLLQLDSLPAWDDSSIESHRWLLLLYIDAVSCQTCVDRLIDRFRVWSKTQNLASVLIARETDDAELRALRRVGRIQAPILLAQGDWPPWRSMWKR
jgi:hypothetical protein